MTTDTSLEREIRGALDASVSRLPYSVTHRLEMARMAALARHRPLARTAAQPALRPMLADGATDPGGRGARWWRFGLAALPVLVLAAGLYAIALWNDSEAADEIAEIDSAMLSDDVPLAAYTDRGFGVFLKNIRQD
jgi:hypothetical protein